MLTNLSLFSGAGGLDLSAKWTGKIKTVAYVEYDSYAQGVLLSRMRSGDLDDAPIFEDVRAFNGSSLKGDIDIVSGGFPCQDVSTAGNRKGIQVGTRSGLWLEFRRIIYEVEPNFILVENVSGLITGGGIGTVLGSLAEVGYDAEWAIISAADSGGPHLRERVWIIAYTRGLGRKSWRETVSKSNRNMGGLQLPHSQSYWNGLSVKGKDAKTIWEVYPRPWIHRVDNGMETYVDCLRLCGNGVVPQQAYPAWQKIIQMSEANP